mgnify:CR=1 FL=1
MEENRELRERIELLEQFNGEGGGGTGAQKDELRKSIAGVSQQKLADKADKASAVDEIMKMRKEKYFLEKRIRELEEQNLYLTAGSGGFYHAPENEKFRNSGFPQQLRRETPTSVMNSTFTSLRSAGGPRFTPNSQINIVDENENHFRTTTNFARNTMYRTSGVKPPELRSHYSSAEPNRDSHFEEGYVSELPPRSAAQKRDFYGLQPIPEQKSVHQTLQTTLMEGTEPEVIERKPQLPPQTKTSSRGSKRNSRPKSQNKTDLFVLSDVYMPKITPMTGKNQLTSREEKLMKLMQDRRVAPKVKGHNNSFF